VQCIQGYQLNIPEKVSTLATCKCSNGRCRWQFNKGDVMCVKCARPSVTRPKGKAIMVGWEQQIVNEWEDGISVLFLIKPWNKSNNGWSIGIDTQSPLSATARLAPSMFTVDAVSKGNQFFSLTISQTSPLWNAAKWKRIPAIVTFEGVSEADKALISKCVLHYYVTPAGDTSCQVDRFDCYPTH